MQIPSLLPNGILYRFKKIYGSNMSKTSKIKQMKCSFESESLQQAEKFEPKSVVTVSVPQSNQTDAATGRCKLSVGESGGGALNTHDFLFCERGCAHQWRRNEAWRAGGALSLCYRWLREHKGGFREHSWLLFGSGVKQQQ